MKWWFSKRPFVWGLKEGNVTYIMRDNPLEDLKLDPKKFLIACVDCHGTGGNDANHSNCERCKGTGFDGGFE